MNRDFVTDDGFLVGFSKAVHSTVSAGPDLDAPNRQYKHLACPWARLPQTAHVTSYCSRGSGLKSYWVGIASGLEI